MSTLKILGLTPSDFIRMARAVRRVEGLDADRPLDLARNWGSDDVSSIGVYNGAASDCPPFGIMLTDGAQVTSRPGWYVDKGKQPDTYGCQRNFLVAQKAGVYSDKFGGAQSGIGNRYVVAYDPADGTPAKGDCWGPRNGTWLAKKNTGGFRVIEPFDTSNGWMLCYAEPMLTFYGKNAGTSDITMGQTGTINIFTGTSGSETDSGVTMPNVLARFGTIPKNSFLQCAIDYQQIGPSAKWYGLQIIC